jgi:hypothetical protein
MFANYNKIEHHLLRYAETYILQERQQFQFIEDIVDAYILNHKDIFASRIETGILTLYTDCLDHIDSLFALLKEKNDTILVYKNKYDASFMLYKRYILKIQKISMFKSFDVSPLLTTAKYLPPSLELIEVYHKLYQIDEYEQWDDYQKLESVLFNNFKSKAKNIAGGQCVKKFTDTINALRRVTLFEFINDSNYVLIGQWAFTLLMTGVKNTKLSNEERLQVITELPIEAFMKDFKSFISQHSKYEFVVKEQNLHLPSDIRLKRYAINVISHDCKIKEQNFMDVFCNGTYELIPYILSNRIKKRKNTNFPKQVKLGNLFVLLRFFFIDIWILQIIELMKKIDLTNEINDIKGKIIRLKQEDILMNKSYNFKYIGYYYPIKLFKKFEEKKDNNR